MEVLVIFVTFVLAFGSASDDDLWRKFKVDYSKTFKSIREENLRFEVFKSNLRMINEHNAKYEKGEKTWFMGINQFTDLTSEEFQKMYLNFKPPKTTKNNGFFKLPLNATVPDAIDWREKGVVLSVKDQGGCNSCWAFSAIGSLEGQNALKHNSTVDLSEQELVDCSTNYDNSGCDGGWMNYAFQYIKDHGISTFKDYTYTGIEEHCKGRKNTSGIKLIGIKNVVKNEEALKEAVGSVGPISIVMNANFIKDYAGGIFNDKACFDFLNHAALAVGYGTEEKHDFWIVKNSWGTNWGEQGYIRMTRNRFNQCGIASKSSFPIIA